MADNSLGSVLEFSQNLKDAEAPEALPDGDYPAEIVEAVNGISNNSGKRRADITFVIKPDYFPPDFVDADAYPDGMQLHFYLSTEDTKAARFRIRKFVESIGAKLGAKIDVNDWVGKHANVTLGSEEFEGVSRNRIQRVSSI